MLMMIKQWVMVDMMSVMNVENYVGDDCSNEWSNGRSIQITNNDSDNDYCNDTHDDCNDSNGERNDVNNDCKDESCKW